MNLIKKLIIVAVVAMLGVGAANAQFRFGVKAGLNMNKLQLDIKNLENNLNGENSVGYTAGVVADFHIPVIGLGFDASLMYTRMNSSTEDALCGQNFIELPVNLKYKFSLPVVGSFLAPYVYTGPSFAFKLDKTTLEYVKTKTCQIAWNVGLGIELFKHLQVGASYGFGINNLVEKHLPGALNPEVIKVRNNYWTISAAYLF